LLTAATLSDVWETIGKIALLAFLAMALLVLVIAFIRKSRAHGFPTPQGSSIYSPFGGQMPPNPLPDWATQDDEPEPRQDFPNR
jgi:hypothetical protein